MSDLLPEVLKGVKEYLEMAKAPRELADLVQLLGGENEQVLHKGFAQYLNTKSFLDKPVGIILVTSSRFIFVAKKKAIPFFEGTEHLTMPLKSLEQIKSVKYRLGHALELTAGSKEYLFLLKNLNTFATAAQLNELVQLIDQARKKSA